MGDLVMTTIFCGGTKELFPEPLKATAEPCGAIFSVSVTPNMQSMLDRARAAGLTI